MIQDPLATSAYEKLAAVGVTPATRHADMLNVSFRLLAAGQLIPPVRRAWEELRLTERRLLVDIFLYDLNLEAEIEEARAALAQRQDADVGAEPLSVAEALELPAAALEQMTRDVRAIQLEPPAAVEPIAEFDLPSAGLLKDVIRFDR